MEGKKIIMAGSNNYLGLTAHPYVKEKAIEAIKKYGTSCSGSRYLTGTIDLHVELEAKLAKFMGKESALLFSTGFQTGQGVIQPLVRRHDTLISDKENHASIVAGNMLAKGTGGTSILRYKHCDMADLEIKLKAARADNEHGILVVVDGVFSTFGEIAPLDDINKLANKYNAQTLVDDAHAFGVIGEGGKGSASHFGLENDIDLTLCTFSKTLASIGGFVVGDERVINYLKHHSPALIFSASPSPASVASASAALDVLIEQPELSEKLRNNAQYIRDGLIDLNFEIIDGETAIVPVLIRDDDKAFLLWKELFDDGVFVNVFVSPATPPGKAMMRNSFMASHTKEHLDKVIDAYAKAGKKLGII
ncbi:UNVERIFIED_CONTAM: hypothetical protein GTU68_033106 [Idotea baltica]|nr:hypothetical protein [Idotea baltica]